MALIAHPVRGKQKSVDICNAFIAGAPKSEVGYVFYGVNASNKSDFEIAKACKYPWYYIDNSYFDCVRGEQFRVTRNAIQHTGAGDTDFKRFNALGVEIAPWRSGGGHIVVCPQSDDFMRNVAAYQGNWLADSVKALSGRFPTRALRVRPWAADKAKLGRTLEKDLADAWALATYTSAAAVTAVAHGVPVLTHPSCAVHMNGWSMSNNATRHHLLGVLADNQFTLKEMKEGFAWHSLHRTKSDAAGSPHLGVQGTGP